MPARLIQPGYALDKLVEQTGVYQLVISQNECGVLVIMQDQLVQPRLSHNNKDAIQVNGV